VVWSATMRFRPTSKALSYPTSCLLRKLNNRRMPQRKPIDVIPHI
jgi:hypothetical protein